MKEHDFLHGSVKTLIITMAGTESSSTIIKIAYRIKIRELTGCE